MFDRALTTSLSSLLLNNLYSDLMLCTALSLFRILGYSALCIFFRYMPAFSIIFSVIKAYSSRRHY